MANKGYSLQTDENRALVYLLSKELQRMLDADSEKGQVAPGSSFTFQQGETFTVTLNDDVTVNRGEGKNGDGIELNAATQNTYGYGLAFFLYEMLQRFGLGNKQMDEIVCSLDEVMQQCGNNRKLADILAERNPDAFENFESWKAELKDRLPKRPQPTPRKIKRDNKLLVGVKTV